MSHAAGRILYCDCAYAKVVPQETKTAVLNRLAEDGVEFEAVPDLCEMAARKDPRLRELAEGAPLKIAACYPRAVRWLFASGGAELREEARVYNMRVESPEAVVAGVLEGVPVDPSPDSSADSSAVAHQAKEEAHRAKEEARSAKADAQADFVAETPTAPVAAKWKPWFPVIDYSRCTNCMQCLSFCLFDVYGVSADKKIQVQNQSNCKTDCPACSRVCPEVAIMFPKYRHGPINGEEVTVDDVRREAMKVDISALLGGDVYSMLRDRSAKAKSRFSKERDDERALKERQTCLVTLKRDLDIPAEVLATLPSLEEIMAKAEAARLRAEAATQSEGKTPEDQA